LKATNFTAKQSEALMYYAYEHGHSAGKDEVLNIAMTLLLDIAEAK